MKRSGIPACEVICFAQERLQRARVLKVTVLGRPHLIECALLVTQSPQCVADVTIVWVLRQDCFTQLLQVGEPEQVRTKMMDYSRSHIAPAILVSRCQFLTPYLSRLSMFDPLLVSVVNVRPLTCLGCQCSTPYLSRLASMSAYRSRCFFSNSSASVTSCGISFSRQRALTSASQLSYVQQDTTHQS